MDEVLHEPGLSDADVARLLGELALGERAAPVLAISGTRAVLASRSLLDLFGTPDLAALGMRLARPDPGARRILQLALDMPVGGAPRLERLRFFLGPVAEPLTVLCRAVVRGGERLLVAAVLSGTSVRPPMAADTYLPPPEKAVSSTDQPPQVTADPPIIEESAATASEAEVAGTVVPDVDLAPLQARLRAVTPLDRLRFAWRADAAGLIVDWPEVLPRLFGAAGDCRGQSLDGIARRWGFDPAGRLAAAARSDRSWTVDGLSWPVAEAPARIPVDLGAVPRQAASGDQDGVQGFGVVHLHALHGGPLVAPPDAPAQLPPAPPAVADGPEPVPPLDDDKIVPLRRGAPVGAARTLSGAEESAFQEIAVLLAGRAPPPAVDAPPPEPADAIPEPVDYRRVLDAQAAGVLVYAGETVLYVNDAFRAWTDPDALLRGPAALFEGGVLRRSDGTAPPVVVDRRSLDWGGVAAELVTAWPETVGSGAGRADVHEADELAAILDTASDGVVLIDPAGTVRAINRTGEALFGHERADVVGQSFDRLVAPSSRAAAGRYFESRRTSGGKVLLNDGCELVGLTAQGGTFPLFMTISAVGADETTFCVLLRDMTHWRKVEQDLREAHERAEQANAAKSDFLAKVSHEIRTPLNAIIGFAEVMMDERLGSLGNERYRDYLRDMHASGTHVISLVNDLLDLAKIDAGKMDLKIAALDLNGVIAGCIALMQVEASRERVIVRQSLAAGLPAVQADERAVKQIMLNLLSNALKYNEPGGQVIVGTTAADTGQVLLRIRDTGIGMSDAEIAIALEPFRTVAPAEAGGGGTGLGLPLTKALAEANGAGFSIRSRKGEGTLVEIAFAPADV